MRARIERELLHGPYRTDRELAAYLGCTVAEVRATTYAFERRTAKSDGWTAQDSQRLDQFVQRYRRALKLGPPTVIPARLPANRRKRQADKLAAA